MNMMAQTENVTEKLHFHMIFMMKGTKAANVMSYILIKCV